MLEKKIAFLGLKNSGISSFIVILLRKFDVEKELRNVKPSKSIQQTEFEYINHKFINIDYSGDFAEPAQFLANKKQNFAEIDCFFFIVDIQNPQTFNDAVNYFGAVLSFLKKIKRKIPVIVSFHKMDPNIMDDPTILENVNQLKEKLQPWLDFTKFQFFTSTIFDPQTMIRAYSAGLRLIFDASELVQNYLVELTQSVENIITFWLFDGHGFLVCEYYLEKMTNDQKKHISKVFTLIQKRINANEQEDYEFSERLDEWTNITNFIQSFDVEGILFYSVLVLQGHEERGKSEQFLSEFCHSIPDLKKILLGLIKI